MNVQLHSLIIDRNVHGKVMPPSVDCARIAQAQYMSVCANMPRSSYTVHRMEFQPYETPYLPEWGPWLMNKVVGWGDIMRTIPNGKVACMLDLNCLVLGKLNPAIADHVTVVFTKRPKSANTMMNGGVMFVRGGPALKQFADHWFDVTNDMASEKYLWHRYSKKWGRLDQAALGRMLSSENRISHQWLPCHIWNCDSTTHQLFDSDRTKVLHISDGRVRDVCLGRRAPASGHERRILDVWNKYDTTQTAGAAPFRRP